MNKHADDYVFGIDKDIQARMRAKYDDEKQNQQLQAQEWIQSLVSDTEFSTSEDGFERLGKMQESLKSGVVLCKLINIIKPDSIKKIYESNMPFKQRENIVAYLTACQALGMPEHDCFVTQDLFEGDNMIAVIDQIFRLGSITMNLEGYTGPSIGVKTSDKNVREFSDEVLNQVVVPMTSQGSIAIEKNKGTDSIVLYGKVGAELGHSVGGVSQMHEGGITVEKNKGTDQIVRYGKVGQEMGKSVGGVSQMHEGSIHIEKEKGTDQIVRYGKVGQEMGESAGGVSQLNEGSIAIEKEKGTDNIVRYGKVGQEMGVSAGGVSQLNEGSLTTEKDGHLDSISRAVN